MGQQRRTTSRLRIRSKRLLKKSRRKKKISRINRHAIKRNNRKHKTKKRVMRGGADDDDMLAASQVDVPRVGFDAGGVPGGGAGDMFASVAVETPAQKREREKKQAEEAAREAEAEAEEEEARVKNAEEDAEEEVREYLQKLQPDNMARHTRGVVREFKGNYPPGEWLNKLQELNNDGELLNFIQQCKEKTALIGAQSLAAVTAAGMGAVETVRRYENPIIPVKVWLVADWDEDWFRTLEIRLDTTVAVFREIVATLVNRQIDMVRLWIDEKKLEDGDTLSESGFRADGIVMCGMQDEPLRPFPHPSGTAVLCIDPQVDFHPGGSLAIKTADDDADRIGQMLQDHAADIAAVHITLDSHQRMHIAHGLFWKDNGGDPPPPYTIISHDDVKSGKWKPVREEFGDWALQYVKGLETSSREGVEAFPLCIWPEHCIIGSPGHNIVPPVLDGLRAWVEEKKEAVDYVLKGQNCFTEMYSALRAEVEVPGDKKTHLNNSLINKLLRRERVLVCGQAKSHCVNFTVRDLVANWPAEELHRIYLLEDGMSSVPGFEGNGEAFIADMKAAGLGVVSVAGAFA